MVTDEGDMMQPGLNLSPHNFVSFRGCLAKNEFLNSRRCQCSSETSLRKSKNTDVLLTLNSKSQLCLLIMIIDGGDPMQPWS